MKVLRKIIQIDEELCDGCGQCVPGCAEGALQIVDGKAKMLADKYCDGLGACLGECPTGALAIVEREADEFDEEAVEAMLSEQERTEAESSRQAAGGCPSATLTRLTPEPSCDRVNEPSSLAGGASALSHWPIKIRLVPPDAPFLRGADLLVLADCCGGASAHLHDDLIQSRVVMMGCPKFDEVEEYIARFEQIFRTADLKSVTCVRMEVPCCSGLSTIVKKAMTAAGRSIPAEEVVIGLRGNVIESKTI
jgi:ferredoxin